MIHIVAHTAVLNISSLYKLTFLAVYSYITPYTVTVISMVQLNFINSDQGYIFLLDM